MSNAKVNMKDETAKTWQKQMGRSPHGRRETYTTRSYASSSSASMTSAQSIGRSKLWGRALSLKLKFRKFKAALLPNEHKSRIAYARVKTLVAVDKKGDIIGDIYHSPITDPKYDAMFLIYIEAGAYPGRGIDIITDGIKYKYNFETVKSNMIYPNLQFANVKLTTGDKHKLDVAIGSWEEEGDWIASGSSISSCSAIPSSISSSTYSTNI